jgi:(4S)-4-hydroxy-5-phosphonooxypentane-2,3-dione isomerase
LPKVILQGHILVAEEDLYAVSRALPIHQELTRKETGCLVFEVSQELSNPNRFNVYEEFVDQGAFDAHQLRGKYSDWGTESRNVERHYQITYGN